jgi:2-desacetyl-2-hydroxyethyl bacteriochlorophyllide A dehydrogenase
LKAVTYQAPGEVRVAEVPEPELTAPTDAIVAVEASGICGSDLHIYHGRVKVEPGTTVGHEFVGKVIAAGDQAGVTPGERVLGCFHTACGRCFFCLRGVYHKCEQQQVFGHGSLFGSLPGTQAERVLVPHAAVTLRTVPSQVSDDVALFAGDVMATAFHGVTEAEVGAGDSVAVLGLGPVGLCAVQVALAAGAGPVVAIDSVEARLGLARRLGAVPVHLDDESPRDAVKRLTQGRGVDGAIDAVGHPAALDLALRLVRKAGTVVAVGVYAEPCEFPMGLTWIKAATLRTGHANVIAHVDRVLAMMAAGTLDPSPLVTHHLPLEQAAEGYAIFDRREALKIVLTP